MQFRSEADYENLAQSFLERWNNAIKKLGEKVLIVEELSHKTDQELKFIRGSQKGAYLIRSGHYQLNIHDSDESRAIRICGPNSLVGYGSWFLRSDTEYSLVALDAGEVVFYPLETLKYMQANSQDINELIIEALCAIIFIKDDRIFALEHISGISRIKLLLYSLTKKFGVPDPYGRLININISRKTLAQLAGVTSESFSRFLTDLEDEGLVRRRRRNIIVTDLRRIRKLN